MYGMNTLASYHAPAFLPTKSKSLTLSKRSTSGIGVGHGFHGLIYGHAGRVDDIQKGTGDQAVSDRVSTSEVARQNIGAEKKHYCETKTNHENF